MAGAVTERWQEQLGAGSRNLMGGKKEKERREKERLMKTFLVQGNIFFSTGSFRLM